MICIPIMAETNDQARLLLAAAKSEPADLYELRFDRLNETPDIEGLIAHADKPVIATCRSIAEGGYFGGTVEERAAVLQRAIDAGAAYVDAEEDVVHLLRRRDGVIIIASWHDFMSVPSDLEEITRRLAELPCDWIKFAAIATRPTDNLTVLRAIVNSPKPAIGIAMGEMGLASRILGPAYGSKLTFGSLSEGRGSAPGQPAARDLAELYRVNKLTRNTAVYGLIGDPVSRSVGYRLHNRGFAENGIDAVYIPFFCRDAEEFLKALPDGLGIRGLSVTMPHKEAAFKWAEHKGESAAAIGAANTLTRTERGWVAENTDYIAVQESLADAAKSKSLDFAAAPALVLGNGGAARAIGVALAGLGCRVAISGRRGEATAELAGVMGWTPVLWDDRAKTNWRVVANATSIGMQPNVSGTPYPAEGWRSGMVAYESVYSPRLTRFLREADTAGCLTVDGMEMFIRQAVEQFKIWTGVALSNELCGQWLDALEDAPETCAAKKGSV